MWGSNRFISRLFTNPPYLNLSHFIPTFTGVWQYHFWELQGILEYKSSTDGLGFSFLGSAKLVTSKILSGLLNFKNFLWLSPLKFSFFQVYTSLTLSVLICEMGGIIRMLSAESENSTQSTLKNKKIISCNWKITHRVGFKVGFPAAQQ